MTLNKTPKIVLALDSYKGSLSSLEAAKAAAEGIRSVFPMAGIVKIPVGDGGEGTLQALINAKKSTLHTTSCHNPISEKIFATQAFLEKTQTAVIEVSQSIGLFHIDKSKADPLSVTSKGVGEQILAALNLGARNFIICLGGSATTDLGSGMLSALGVRFYKGKKKLEATPRELFACDRIDFENLDPRLKRCKFIAVCDVDNPLAGKNGAAYTFAPQKGASPDECAYLNSFLEKLGRLYEFATKTSILTEAKMGAAGGIAAALAAFLDAELVQGSDFVLEFIDFKSKIVSADLIITGEGALDHQTLHGKTPMGVLKLASDPKIPVVLLAGKVPKDTTPFRDAGFKAVFSISPGPLSLEESLEYAPQLLASTAANVVSLFF